MPTYEYKCLDCGRKFEAILSYAEYGQKAVVCSHCGSAQVQRRIGRVRISRTEMGHMEALADPNRLAQLDDDPQALGSMMREMSDSLGEDMGSEFDEVVDRLESGQSPEQIEDAMPDLGADDD